MSDTPEVEDLFKTLATIAQHRAYVASAMQWMADVLRHRASVHDLSKYRPDELEGFARINRAAREHPYGSAEYRASLKQEKPTIALHYDRNDHHPEHWERPDHNIGPGMMGVFALLEMVCDWWAAWKVYETHRKPEDRASWQDNLERQRARFGETLASWQWHVIEDVAPLLEKAP
jgi:Family of unknown function (DUF5662)